MFALKLGKCTFSIITGMPQKERIVGLEVNKTLRGTKAVKF